MLAVEDKAKAEQLHSEYMQALSAGDMESVAALFTFPAVFKGFLEDVIVAEDARQVPGAYAKLIAVAPKAARMQLLGIDVSMVRPQVLMLTMTYEQFGADDKRIHSGQALYFMKPVDGVLKLFAVI